MTNWEYRIVPLAPHESLATGVGDSAAVTLLNDQGRQGWEAVGITEQAADKFSVLMKRPLAQARASGGRM